MSALEAAREQLNKSQDEHAHSVALREDLRRRTREAANRVFLANAKARSVRGTPESVPAAERALSLAADRHELAQQWYRAALAARRCAEKVLDDARRVHELAEEDLYVAEIIEAYERELAGDPTGDED